MQDPDPDAYKKRMQHSARYLIGQIAMQEGQLEIRQKRAEEKQARVDETLKKITQLKIELQFIKDMFSKEPPIDKSASDVEDDQLKESLDKWESGGKPIIAGHDEDAIVVSRNRYVNREYDTLAEFEKGEHLPPEPDLGKVEDMKQKYASLLDTAQGAMNKGWSLSGNQINFMLLMLLKNVVEENK